MAIEMLESGSKRSHPSFSRADHFATSGVRKLALALVDDAVNIVVLGEPEDLVEHEKAWLHGEVTGCPITAFDCFAILGIDTWEQQFLTNLDKDPEDVRRRLRAIMRNVTDFTGGQSEQGFGQDGVLQAERQRIQSVVCAEEFLLGEADGDELPEHQDTFHDRPAS